MKQFDYKLSKLASALAAQRGSALGLTLIAACVASPAWANPTGANVVRGASLASNPTANVLQIVNTPGTIINWQGFSIANGETTRFVQLNGASTMLNRVVGGNPSNILGRMESNGRVFLINPNGIVFGGGSVVDTAGLIASTRNITDANFAAGNYSFSGTGPGTITLQSGAVITTANYAAAGGGQVWLIAKDVTLSAGSSITAPSGQVVMAAGTQVDVGTTNVGQMSFTVLTDGNSTVNSLGLIAADRGAVGMFADFINHQGTINAGNRGSVAMNATKELRLQGTSQVNAPDGNITLRGGRLLEVEYDAVVNADGANGKISFESNNVLVAPSGNIHALGGVVTFNQFLPSQYTSSASQQAWVTPTGFSDGATIVYRRSDGNYVLRFSRMAPSGDMVGLFEVTMDGRTGALLSGPTAIAAGSAEATAYNTARATYNRGNPVVPNSIQATYDASSDAAWTAYRSANAAAFAPYVRADTELRAANNIASGRAVAAGDQYQASVTELFRRVSNSELGYSVASPELSVPLAELGGYAYSPADRTSLLASALATRESAQTAINNYIAPFVQAKASALLAFQSTDQQLADTRRDAINAAGSAYNAAYGAFRNTTRAAFLAGEAAYYSTITAGIPVFYSDGSNIPAVAPSSVPTGDGGSIAWFGQPNSAASGFNVRASSGAVVSTQGNNSGFALPMPDGTYLFQTPGSYNVKTLNDTLVRTDPLPTGNDATLVPNQAGGFSVIDATGSNRMRWQYTKDVAPYSPSTSVTGSTGLASSFALRAGLANGEMVFGGGTGTNAGGTGGAGGTAGVGGTGSPSPLVRGRASGGASFAGVAGCNGRVCEEAVGAANAAVDAQRAAQRVAAPVASGGAIGEQAAADAVQALGLFSENEQRFLALQRATGQTMNASAATIVGVFMKDNGDLRRLVNGSRLDQMTPAQRLAAIDAWLAQEARSQAVGQGADPRSPNELATADFVANMNATERQVWVDERAREQANGQQP